MDYLDYDNSNPGLPGVFRVGELEGSTEGRGYYRKWDGQSWYMVSYSDTILSARLKDKKYGYACDGETKLFYVADLEGNLVEPREARRIGDPLWNSRPEPEQLELF
jgi:hypothetical protein